MVSSRNNRSCIWLKYNFSFGNCLHFDKDFENDHATFQIQSFFCRWLCAERHILSNFTWCHGYREPCGTLKVTNSELYILFGVQNFTLKGWKYVNNVGTWNVFSSSRMNQVLQLTFVQTARTLLKYVFYSWENKAIQVKRDALSI